MYISDPSVLLWVSVSTKRSAHALRSDEHPHRFKIRSVCATTVIHRRNCALPVLTTQSLEIWEVLTDDQLDSMWTSTGTGACYFSQIISELNSVSGRVGAATCPLQSIIMFSNWSSRRSTNATCHALQVGGSRFRKYLQRKICKIFSDLITRCNIAQINFFDDYYVWGYLKTPLTNYQVIRTTRSIHSNPAQTPKTGPKLSFTKVFL